jgi:psp operon transcriptional activator
LHLLSKRWQGPFVTLNCATLSPSLIEAELFGYERGAFTGAEKRRSGRFEAADGGTLFLDEIGSIPREAQEKILRVVEYGSFERVGSTMPVEVDVRIVGATNVDLAAMAEREDFKRDLLDRLSFEVLFLPPLRHRGEDILLLAGHFATRMAYELGRQDIPAFSAEAERLLQAHPWKGNIRELKNVVERAVYRCEAGLVEDIVFDPFVSPYGSLEVSPSHAPPSPELKEMRREPGEQARGLDEKIAALEKDELRRALIQCRYNQRRAAAQLGLSYDQLRSRLKKYGTALSAEKV